MILSSVNANDLILFWIIDGKCVIGYPTSFQKQKKNKMRHPS